MKEESSDKVIAVLEERARVLARPAEVAERHEGIEVVVLVTGEERYGVEIHHVREVQPACPTTPVPDVPAFWAGVANVRGGLYPVLDLGRYMGSGAGRDDGVLVLASAAGVTVGLLVDDVTEAREIRTSDMRSPLSGGPDPKSRAIRGTTADLLSVLDLDALLSDPHLVVEKQA
jgi:chemotaxis signal transduction protein